MDNNVNNENNVNVGNVVPNVNTDDAAQLNIVPDSNEIVQPTAPTAIQPTIITQSQNSNASSTVTPVVTNQSNVKNNENMQAGYYKKFFVMMGIIVGGVLLISGILLYFLLNGTIENRNRLTCTKTVQGEGYEEHIIRYYTFDNKIMQRVYVTHTFTYNELTDDMYNQTFDEIINNKNHFISKYGLGTDISRKDKVVKISAYDINYLGEDVKDIEKKNKDENFTCE